MLSVLFILGCGCLTATPASGAPTRFQKMLWEMGDRLITGSRFDIFVDGRIDVDDLRVYDRRLSLSEDQGLYNLGRKCSE